MPHLSFALCTLLFVCLNPRCELAAAAHSCLIVVLRFCSSKCMVLTCYGNRCVGSRWRAGGGGGYGFKTREEEEEELIVLPLCGVCSPFSTNILRVQLLSLSENINNWMYPTEGNLYKCFPSEEIPPLLFVCLNH